MQTFLLELAEKARHLAESSYGVAQERLLSVAAEAEGEAELLRPAFASPRNLLDPEI